MFRLLKIENARMSVPEPEYLPADAVLVWQEDAVYNASAAITGTQGKSDPDDDGQAKALGATWKNYAGTKSYTCVGVDIESGTALVLSSGKLVKATGTTVPKFISMADKPYGDVNRSLPVMRVSRDMLFEVETSADASSNKIGTLVTLDGTGTKVTATASSGVATIVENHATASGDKITVRFAQ